MPEVDWTKVNWFSFFPPIFAIYLTLVAFLAKSYLKSRVEVAVNRLPAVAAHKDFLFNLASGWATQLSFINALVAAIVSSISIWSSTGNFVGVSLTVSLFLLIVVPMMWYLFTHEPDQIVAVSSTPIGTAADVCKYVLIVLNVALIVAIFIAQQSAQKTP